MAKMEKFGVGQAVRRVEDERLLTGKGQFIDDIVFDNVAYAAFVRSPYARAKITSFDIEEAQAASGVIRVLTGEDYAKEDYGPLPSLGELVGMDENGIRCPERHGLTRDVVNFVGDPVAVVIAESQIEAQNAAELVLVEYEELEPSVELADTLNKDAPVIWPEFGNNRAFRVVRGDEQATNDTFARAAHVVELDLINNRLAPAAIEPRGAVGEWNEDDQRFTLHVSGQAVFNQRMQMAQSIFKIPLEQMRVVAYDVGGSFGAKNFIYPENVTVCWAAKICARPVKWIASRSENFMTEIHARDHVTSCALALDEHGKFLAMRIKTLANMGAYLSTFAPVIPTVASWVVMGGAYEIPHIYADINGVFTNTVPVDAYRGAGRPEASYIAERLVEKAAFELGIDALELRRKNFISSFPYETAMGLKVDCGGFAENLETACQNIDFKEFNVRRKETESRGKLRGIGVSSYLEITLGGPEEDAELVFEDDGTLTLLAGTHSVGQGHETTYKQMIFTELGIAPDRVNYVQGDTAKIKSGGGHGWFAFHVDGW